MLDKALEEAIIEAVITSGQPDAVARRITAWLRQMSQGPLVKEDDARFLIEVCNELDLENVNED